MRLHKKLIAERLPWSFLLPAPATQSRPSSCPSSVHARPAGTNRGLLYPDAPLPREAGKAFPECEASAEGGLGFFRRRNQRKSPAKG